MEVDDVAVMALIFGGFAVLSSTILRYLIHSKSRTCMIKRLLTAVSVIDIRQNKSEVRLLLFQYTGVIWVLLGTIYSIISARFNTHGAIEYFELVGLLVPGLLMVVMISILRRLFWK